MAQDLRCLISNPYSTDEFSLVCKKLNEALPTLRPRLIKLGLIPDELKESEDLQWKFHKWDVFNQFHLTDGFWIYSFPQTAEIGTWIRWKEFRSDKEIQQNLNILIQEISTIFKSRECLFYPDSASQLAEEVANEASEGLSYEEIKGHLLKKAEALDTQAASDTYLLSLFSD